MTSNLSSTSILKTRTKNPKKSKIILSKKPMTQRKSSSPKRKAQSTSLKSKKTKLIFNSKRVPIDNHPALDPMSLPLLERSFPRCKEVFPLTTHHSNRCMAPISVETAQASQKRRTNSNQSRSSRTLITTITFSTTLRSK